MKPPKKPFQLFLTKQKNFYFGIHVIEHGFKIKNAVF